MIDLEFSILNYFLFSGLRWGDDGCFGWDVKHYSVLCNLNGPLIITLFSLDCLWYEITWGPRELLGGILHGKV